MSDGVIFALALGSILAGFYLILFVVMSLLPKSDEGQLVHTRPDPTTNPPGPRKIRRYTGYQPEPPTKHPSGYAPHPPKGGTNVMSPYDKEPK